jgi:hypothetical protein
MWLVGRASLQGELLFPKEPLLKILGWTVTVLAGWIAYTVHLFKRDRKREKIRFAREMGRIGSVLAQKKELLRFLIQVAQCSL